jgi:glucose-1-phosphate cytidylyltransferase
MVNIGYRPILWHVMKYYSHFGHKEFILCLGYKADVIKDYFLRYDEAISNDFVLDGGGAAQLLNTDIEDWRITFVDTGVTSNIGERLRRVRPYLEGDDVFLANYSDGVTDLDLPAYIEEVRARDKIASFLCVRPTQTFHVVKVRDGGIVTDVAPVTESDVWINAGFFLLKQEIFDHIHEGDELAVEPFKRLIAADELFAYKYTGFWTAMDTFKDRERLEDMWSAGKAPWMLW